MKKLYREINKLLVVYSETRERREKEMGQHSPNAQTALSVFELGALIGSEEKMIVRATRLLALARIEKNKESMEILSRVLQGCEISVAKYKKTQLAFLEEHLR